MLSLWIVLVYMMADVIGRGHGGDGAEEPPPPGGDDFWRGHGADGKLYNKSVFTIFTSLIIYKVTNNF